MVTDVVLKGCPPFSFTSLFVRLAAAAPPFLAPGCVAAPFRVSHLHRPCVFRNSSVPFEFRPPPPNSGACALISAIFFGGSLRGFPFLFSSFFPAPVLADACRPALPSSFVPARSLSSSALPFFPYPRTCTPGGIRLGPHPTPVHPQLVACHTAGPFRLSVENSPFFSLFWDTGFCPRHTSAGFLICYVSFSQVFIAVHLRSPALFLFLSRGPHLELLQLPAPPPPSPSQGFSPVQLRDGTVCGPDHQGHRRLFFALPPPRTTSPFLDVFFFFKAPPGPPSMNGDLPASPSFLPLRCTWAVSHEDLKVPMRRFLNFPFLSFALLPREYKTDFLLAGRESPPFF